MAYGIVFDSKETVFFAGDGEGSDDNAGGCLKSWWDTQCPNGTEAETAAAMAKLMDFDGRPIVEEDDCSYTTADQKIAISGVESDAEVGMLAYIHDPSTGGIVEGIYEITEVGTNYIKCEDMEDGSADNTVGVIIGGEFLLQDALNETDATNHSVEIYVRHNLVLESTTINIDVGGGNNTKNTFKRIVGFNTSPGDMNIGGTYYESPLEILKAGTIDNTKAVLLDGDNGDISIFNISVNNIVIENFHFYNSGGANAITFIDAQYIVLRNCRFSTVNSAFASGGDNLLADSCYTHNNLISHSYAATGWFNIFLNCVGNVKAATAFINMAGDYGSVIGCVAAGGQYGVQFLTAGNHGHVMNNTFYGMTSQGVRISSGGGVVVMNNIFALASGVGAVGLYVTGTGSFVYNDYNCFIESDGTPLTVGSHGSGYEAPVKGPHSIEVDPLFVDAANYDFRPANNSPCIDAGRPDSLGGWSTIGAYDYSANRGVSRSRVIGGV